MRGAGTSVGTGAASRGSWSVSLLATAVAIGAIATSAIAATSPGRTSSSPEAAKKCTRAVVGGERSCLKTGQRCKKRFQDDYVAAGLSCRRGRLRNASLAEQRGGEPLLIDEHGQISLKTALAGFDSTVASLPGVKAKKGEIGVLDDATSVVGEIDANLDRLSTAQRAAFLAATTPDANAIEIPMSGAPARQHPGAARRAPAAAPSCSPQSETLEEEQFARAALGDAKQSLVAHGWPLPQPVKLCFLTDQGGESATTNAFVKTDNIPPGTSTTCNMFVTRRGRGKSAIAQQYLYAHELAALRAERDLQLEGRVPEGPALGPGGRRRLARRHDPRRARRRRGRRGPALEVVV